ncbi:MAG: hypothetical protein CMK59_13805 [Proteobacteria bacterium]|nr:hypothetical protein [Pseudomonadota bacterium]
MFIRLLLVVLTTWLTEVGGFLIWPMLSYSVDDLGWRLVLKRYSYPILSYILGSVLIIPVLAAQMNSVPLPCFTKKSVLKPQTRLTCILNRHYVQSNVLESLVTLSKQLSRRYDSIDVRFLDGGHPFAIIPPFLNFSHRNGRSVDLSFMWRDDLGKPSSSPSPMGYGGYTSKNNSRACSSENQLHILDTPISMRWDLSWLQNRLPRRTLDTKRTRTLISYAASNPELLAIFIEPSLHSEIGSKNGKTMANPCSWIRHDDHMQLYFAKER